jgi:hypothetical protein
VFIQLFSFEQKNRNIFTCPVHSPVFLPKPVAQRACQNISCCLSFKNTRQNTAQKELKMTLAQLKLTAAKKPTHISPALLRRHKLLRRIDEQIAFITAQQNGTTYAASRLRSYTDAESGLRKTVEVPKVVKTWTFVADNGKLCVQIKYGARVIELARGKAAVEVSSAKELVSTFELIKQAVINGELDAHLDAASVALRKGFTND